MGFEVTDETISRKFIRNVYFLSKKDIKKRINRSKINKNMEKKYVKIKIIEV